MVLLDQGLAHYAGDSQPHKATSPASSPAESRTIAGEIEVIRALP
jgi:hypothetical protein